MRTVQLYIEDQRVDLFKDEEIVVTSSVQNIADIAKVFTDYTQTFTVPASKNNNDIFDHFYNSDVDATFVSNTRVSARIEINNAPFREGKIQLEGSEIKDNQAQSYSLTFYGDFVTLKDLFGDDKLSDLDYSAIQEELTGANVQTSITSTADLDVRYPLISSSRVWSYGDANVTDISLSAYAIDYSELFPAIKDKVIMDAIEAKYGVTFTGNFLGNKRFTNSFTWWKNRETANFTSEPLDLEFNLGGASCLSSDIPNAVGISVVNVDYVDISTYTTPSDWVSWEVNQQFHNVKIYIDNTSGADTWYLDIYKNGTYNNTITSSGNGLHTIAGAVLNTAGLDDSYTFKMRCDASITFDFEIIYQFSAAYINTSNQLVFNTVFCQHTTTGNAISVYYDFNGSAPEQTVAEWFSGTLKEFNLTCYPQDEALTYQIEPLEDFYRFGEEQNITEFVDVKSIKIDRVKLYNEISFGWQDSKSFMNEAFKELNNKQYGSLQETFPLYDGGKYEVKLPFETLLFQKFTNENLQVGYSLTKSPDYKPYIPKPTKLYLYENQATDVDFYFDNGTTTDLINNYVPFGQDLDYNTQNFSMNFNEEVSSLLLTPVSNTLYSEYYLAYLKNLFNTKTRKVTVECILPLDLLTSLTLDDKVIIRDKAYRIDSTSSNLTTGNVKLVLFNDWTPTRRKVTFPVVHSDGGTIVVPVKPVKDGYISISDPAETKFITSSPILPFSPLESQKNITITVPANTGSANRYQTITFTSYKPNGDIEWQEVAVLRQDGIDEYLLLETGDDILTEAYDKIKL